MTRRTIVNIDGLLAANPEFVRALGAGESWAIRHLRICESLNGGEPEGFRRPFDGIPRRWCGEACDSDNGCVMCTLPEDPEIARLHRTMRRDPMRLAARGIITIDGEVNSAMRQRVRAMIAKAEAAGTQELEVRIRTTGGQTVAGLGICDLIANARVERRVGVVVDYALSMGTIVLQSCDWRVAPAHARLLLHHGHFDKLPIPLLRDDAKVARLLSQVEPSERRVEEMLLRRTGRTLAEITAACDRDTEMSGVEALQFGLIDALCGK